MPEALTNLRRLLQAAALLQNTGPLLLLAPTGARPTPEEWQPLLQELGYRPQTPAAGSGATAAWRSGSTQLWIGPGRFSAWAGWAEVGLAAAGTATEQLVGLGIPALSLPGPGPSSSVASLNARAACSAVLSWSAPVLTPWPGAWSGCCTTRAGWRSWVGSVGAAWAAPVAARPRVALVEHRLLPGP